jgi:small conductance mechanosensitive channel
MQWIDSDLFNHLLETYFIPWGLKALMALVVFLIGRWAVALVVALTKRLMVRANVDVTLGKFLRSIIRVVLMVAVVIAALDQLGVNTTSLLAILGAAGLAVGLALKDSLSNFAAGVMLILFRPFRLGDFIEAAGTSGVVENIQIFSTVLRTGDNRQIVVPNGPIFGGTIVNVSAKPTRRIDLVIGIGYDDDIRQAMELIQQVLAAEARILENPAPALSVADLADSSVNLNVRPWVNSEDYWAVRSDLLENIKRSFDANGVSIPYPQRDVHVHQVGPQAA